MQFHSEEERQQYLRRKSRNQKAYRDRKRQQDAEFAKQESANKPSDFSNLTLPIDSAADFNGAFWYPDRIANLSEIVASAEALLAAPMAEDFESRRIRHAAERFLAEHRNRTNPVAPQTMAPPIPPGVSQQALAEVEAAERANELKKKKAAENLKKWEAEHSNA